MCLVMACTLQILSWGCRPDTPKATSRQLHPTSKLLAQLMSMDESVRFDVQVSALKQIKHVDRQELEEALTALGRKNVSTLIYVCIKSGRRILYEVSPPARMVLEAAAGSFPNIAYYYARVAPESGLDELLRLYRRHPAERLSICLAIGEIQQPEAISFLWVEAQRLKSGGKSAIAQLHGLKGASEGIDTAELFIMLDQRLDREEVIALAELDVRLSDEELKTLWQSGAIKRNFAIQCILGNPEFHYESLSWVVDRYLEAGQTDAVLQ